jgi:hypothetical protein
MNLAAYSAESSKLIRGVSCITPLNSYSRKCKRNVFVLKVLRIHFLSVPCIQNKISLNHITAKERNVALKVL